MAELRYKTKVCEHCGKKFQISQWQSLKKYCSDRCQVKRIELPGRQKTKIIVKKSNKSK